MISQLVKMNKIKRKEYNYGRPYVLLSLWILLDYILEVIRTEENKIFKFN